jgi:hypothetical protein
MFTTLIGNDLGLATASLNIKLLNYLVLIQRLNMEILLPHSWKRGGSKWDSVINKTWPKEAVLMLLMQYARKQKAKASVRRS